MWPQEFIWFFAIFYQEFRQGNGIAFAVLMMLACAHFFGFYNPKQLADFLGIPHQKFSTEGKPWSVYQLKKMLLRFMVKQAVEYLKPVWHKSAATPSRAGMTGSIDHRVMDRCGTLLQCTWSWLSGRHHAVVRGPDVLGMVLTINHIACPLHWLFCPKQGRYTTHKAALGICMLSRLKTACALEGMESTTIPLTMDSWFVSQPLRTRLHRGGLTKIISAGKSHYTFTMHGKHQKTSQWKKDLVVHDPTWGIDVPSCRVHAQSPTCGSIILFFFQKRTTHSYYWMNFSQVSMRGAEIWHIWKQHHLIACFWKILKSICQIRSMQLQGDGLYTSLLIKVLTSLLALRMKARREFSQSTITQIMRNLSRHHDLRDFMTAHFHHTFSITEGL